MMEKKYQYGLWSLALPIAFESLFQMLYGIADTYVLSSYSDNAVAATGYANQIISILLLLFRVIASGTSILLAQSIGSGEKEHQRQICSAGFFLSFMIGMIVSIITVIIRKPLLVLLQVDDTLLPYASDYLKIRGLGLLFSSLFTVLTAIYRSRGNSVFPSVISAAANIINIVGDLLVIHGELHFLGAVQDVALVTTVADGLACFTVCLIMLFNDPEQILQKPKINIISSILQLGIPAAGESCSYRSSQLIVTLIIGQLGAQALTAKIYGMNLAVFIVLIPDSIAVAAGIMVGVYAGKGDFAKAKRTAFACIKKGTLAVTAVDIPLVLFGRFLLSQFTDHPSILQLAYIVLVMEAVTMFIKNANLTLGNSLRAIKDVNYPAIISVVSMWTIGAGLAWFLGIFLGFGLPGIFAAFFADEAIRSMLLYKRFVRKIFDL